MSTSHKLRFQLKQRERQASIDQTDYSRSELRLNSSNAIRPSTNLTQQSPTLRSTKYYRKMFNNAASTDTGEEQPRQRTGTANGKQQMKDTMAAQQKKTLLYLIQHGLNENDKSQKSTTTLTNELPLSVLKTPKRQENLLTQSPRDQGSTSQLAMQSNGTELVVQIEAQQNFITHKQCMNMKSEVFSGAVTVLQDSLDMSKQHGVLLKSRHHRQQSNEDYDDFQVRLTEQAQDQTRYKRPQSDVNKKTMHAVEVDDKKSQLTINVSKSTMNQDLENVDDGSKGSLKLISDRKSAEDQEERQKKNIEKLLRMTEQRIACELSSRRSLSVALEARTQKQNMVQFAGKADVPELQDGCLQSSVILLDKKHRDLCSTESHDNSKPERPYAWRKSISISENPTSDYKSSRYQAADALPTNSKIVDNKMGMGPFYQRYINQMEQSFVKDRVLRLKESYEVVQSGQRILDTEENRATISPLRKRLDARSSSLNLSHMTSAQQNEKQIMNTEEDQDDMFQARMRMKQERKGRKKITQMNIKNNSTETMVERDDPKQHITINLPDTEHGRDKKQATAQSPASKHEDSLELRHDSIQTVDEQQSQQNLLMQPQNPGVIIIGGQVARLGTGQQESQDLHNMSLFSTMTAHRDQINLNNARNGSAGCQHGLKQPNTDIRDQLLKQNGTMPKQQYRVHEKRQVQNDKKCHQNKTQPKFKENLTRKSKDYKQPQHIRSSSQNKSKRKPNLLQDSVQQLVDETIRHMYVDMNVPTGKNKPMGYMRKKKQLIKPIDLAVLKQKAFKQFDLINEAEKNLQSTIKSKKQISFGKEHDALRENQKFKYSNIKQKLMVEEDPTRLNHQEFTDSVMNNSNFMSESNGMNLSLLQSKQKMAARKLCKSCIEPRTEKPPAGPLKDALALQRKARRSVMCESEEERLAADLQDGSYYKRLNHNLKVTKDYNKAADRTRRIYNLAESLPENKDHEEESDEKADFIPLKSEKLEKPMTLEEKIKAIAARIKQEEPCDISLNTSHLDMLQPKGSQWVGAISTSGGLMVCSTRTKNSQDLPKQDASGVDLRFKVQSLIYQNQPYERANTSHEVVTGQNRRSQQKIIINAQHQMLRVPSSLYSIDQFNASLLEHELPAKKQVEGYDAVGVVSLTRANNSNICRTSGGNRESNSQIKIAEAIKIDSLQSIEGSKKRKDVQRKQNTQNGDLDQVPSLMHLCNESEKVPDKQVNDPNGGDSSERQALTVKDKNNQPGASGLVTKSDDMSDAVQDETYALHKKYSQVSSGCYQAKKKMQRLESKASALAKTTQVSEDLRPSMPQYLTQPEQVARPGVISQSTQMYALKIKQAQIGGSIIKPHREKRMSQSPIKSRFRIPRQLHQPRMAPLVIDNTNRSSSNGLPVKQKSAALISKSIDRNYTMVNDQKTFSAIDEFSSYDVATLADKSPFDTGSKFSIGNNFNKSMQKNFQMTLKVNKSLQIKGLNKITKQLDKANRNDSVPKHHQPQGAMQRWKSPFQAHIEREEAKKQMLEYIVRHRPQETINQTIESSPRQIEGIDYQQNVLGIGTTAVATSLAMEWFNSAEQQLPQSGRTYSMLEPWDFNSQVRQDSSQFSLANKGSSHERSLPVMQQVKSQNQKRRVRKNSSGDQTEDLNDYGTRTKTADKKSSRRFHQETAHREDLMTPATEMRPLTNDTFDLHKRELTVPDLQSPYDLDLSTRQVQTEAQSHENGNSDIKEAKTK